MVRYLVSWHIDIEADTPREAAQMARAAQVRADTSAVVFHVHNNDGPQLGPAIIVDLMESERG